MFRSLSRRKCLSRILAMAMAVTPAAAVPLSSVQATERIGAYDYSTHLQVVHHSAATVMIPVIDFPGAIADLTPPWEDNSLSEEDDTVAWSDWGGLGTHDSGPLAPIDQLATDSIPLPSMAEHRIASLDSSLAGRDFLDQDSNSKGVSAVGIASAWLGTRAIQVQQIIEPFAMVGPQLKPQDRHDAVEQVGNFLSWWSQRWPATSHPSSVQETAEQNVQANEYVTKDLGIDPVASGLKQRGGRDLLSEWIESMDDRLNQLASLEPIDVEYSDKNMASLESTSPLALAANTTSVKASRSVAAPEEQALPIIQCEISADEFPIEPLTDLVVTKRDPLVGSAASVYTLYETYQPYDLSEEDLALWNILSTRNRPFAPREPLGQSTAMSMEIGSLGDVVAVFDLEQEAAFADHQIANAISIPQTEPVVFALPAPPEFAQDQPSGLVVSPVVTLPSRLTAIPGDSFDARVGRWIEWSRETSPVFAAVEVAVTPEGVEGGLHGLVREGRRKLQSTLKELAGWMPVEQQRRKIAESPASRLLARAGAIEADVLPSHWAQPGFLPTALDANSSIAWEAGKDLDKRQSAGAAEGVYWPSGESTNYVASQATDSFMR